MTKTSKNRKSSTNKTKKNIKCSKIIKNNYKTCKSKIYKSMYGGRYTTNIFI